jgi:Na+-driven multidrug efflux pump
MDLYKNTVMPAIRPILGLAIPIAVSNVIGIAAILVNTKILGSVGHYNLYLLALFLPINYFQVAMCEAFRAPALSLLHGSRQELSALLIISSATVIASVVLFEFSKNYLSKAFHVPVTIQQEFLNFTASMLLLGVFICANVILTSVFYGIGKQRLAMGLSVLTAISTCCLTYLFSKYYELGIHGLVYAVSISNGVICLFALFVLKSFIKLPRRADYSSVLKSIGKLGSPIWFSYIILFSGLFLFNKILAHFGTDIISGFGVAYRLQSLVVIPAIAIGMAIAILVNRHVASGQLFKAQVVLRTGIILSLLFYVIVSPVLFFWRQAAIGFITTDYSVAQAASHYLSYTAFSYIGLGPLLVFLVMLDQTGSGIKSLSYSILSFATEFAVGGWLALRSHNIDYFYLVIAIVNALSFLFVFFECFCRRKQK